MKATSRLANHSSTPLFAGQKKKEKEKQKKSDAELEDSMGTAYRKRPEKVEAPVPASDASLTSTCERLGY